MGNIVFDTSQLNKLAKDLKGFEKEIPSAFTSALNRTLDHTVTQVKRQATKEYNVLQSDIDKAMKPYKATYRTPKAWIQIRSRRYSLSRFLPGGLNSNSKKAKVKVKKGGGRKLVDNAFVRKVTRKRQDGTEYTNTLILRRKGNSNYPVEVLRTLSPTQMVENPKVMNEVMKAANKKLDERITHEVDRRLKKMGFK